MDKTILSITDGMLAKLAANDASMTVKIKQGFDKACALVAAVDKIKQEIELVKKDSDQSQALADQIKQEIERMDQDAVHARIMHEQCLDSIKNLPKQLESMQLDIVKRKEKRKEALKQYEQIIQKQKILQNLNPLIQAKRKAESELLQIKVHVQTTRMRLNHIRRARRQFKDIQTTKRNNMIVKFIQWVKNIHKLREKKTRLIRKKDEKTTILNCLREQYEFKMEEQNGSINVQSKLSFLTQKYNVPRIRSSRVFETSTCESEVPKSNNFNELFKSLQQRSSAKKIFESFALPPLLSWKFTSTLSNISSNMDSPTKASDKEAENLELPPKKKHYESIADQNMRTKIPRGKAEAEGEPPILSEKPQRIRLYQIANQPVIDSQKNEATQSHLFDNKFSETETAQEPVISKMSAVLCHHTAAINIEHENSLTSGKSHSDDMMASCVADQNLSGANKTHTEERHLETSILRALKRVDNENSYPVSKRSKTDDNQKTIYQQKKHFDRGHRHSENMKPATIKIAKEKESRRSGESGLHFQKLYRKSKADHESVLAFDIENSSDRKDNFKRVTKSGDRSVDNLKTKSRDKKVKRKREPVTEFKSDSKYDESFFEEPRVEVPPKSDGRQIVGADDGNARTIKERKEFNANEGSVEHSHYFKKTEEFSNTQSTMGKQQYDVFYTNDEAMHSSDQQFLENQYIRSEKSSVGSFQSPKSSEDDVGVQFDFASGIDQLFNTNDGSKDDLDNGFSFNFGVSSDSGSKASKEFQLFF